MKVQKDQEGYSNSIASLNFVAPESIKGTFAEFTADDKGACLPFKFAQKTSKAIVCRGQKL
jgi:hypothetical protein